MGCVMARKPVTQYANGHGPRQRIWNAIRQLHKNGGGEPFTELNILSIAEGAKADLEIHCVRDYRRCLVAAGILEEAGDSAGSFHRATYRLVKDEGIEAPRVRKDGTRVTQGLAQEQMWRTLRMNKGDINARELASHASTTAIPVAETAAKDYFKHLHAAGYLEVTEAAVSKGRRNRLARYRLIKNTGPRPPMVQKTDAIYDPNLGEVVWVRPVNEETAIYGS